MITIIIPTFNRPHFIKRALEYYASLQYEGFLFIGDSSEDSIAARNQANILKYSKRLHIVYRHFPKPAKGTGVPDEWIVRDSEGNIGYRDGGIVLAELGATAPTPYVAFSGDDDFLVPNSLVKCALFLERNPSYSAAHGLRLHFALEPDSNFRRIVRTRYVPEHLLESADPGERWTGYMRYAYSTQFYVHRRETWQRMYAAMPGITEHYLGAEVLPCSMTCILSKVAQVDCLATLFQENYGYEKTFSWESHSVYGLALGPNWHRSVQGLRSALAGALAQQGGSSEREAQEVFDREFRLHLVSFLEWQFEAKYGRIEQAPLTLNPAPFTSVYELVMSPQWHGWVTGIRAEATQNLTRNLNLAEPAAREYFDKWLWINLMVQMRNEHQSRFGDEAAWWNGHRHLMAGLNQRYAAPLELENLLSPSSPYHKDFMPVYKIVQETV